MLITEIENIRRNSNIFIDGERIYGNYWYEYLTFVDYTIYHYMIYSCGDKEKFTNMVKLQIINLIRMQNIKKILK